MTVTVTEAVTKGQNPSRHTQGDAPAASGPPASDQSPRFRFARRRGRCRAACSSPFPSSQAKRRLVSSDASCVGGGALVRPRAPLLGKRHIFRISLPYLDISVISNILQLRAMIASCRHVSVLFRGVFLGKFLDVGLLGQRGHECVFRVLPSPLARGRVTAPQPRHRPRQQLYCRDPKPRPAE